MNKIVRYFTVLFLLIAFGSISNASEINIFNPVFRKAITSGIDVRKLGSEINGKSSEYPMYISELNSGLIYCIDYKANDNTGSRDFVFSVFDSVSMVWSYPVSISSEYQKFQQENIKMNYQNIFITMDNDIYIIDFKSKKDFAISKLNISSKSYEGNATLSPDGSTLYFVSERKGGYGGKDIYASERLSNGNWSEPYNLGPQVNTELDEETPFIMNDGVTLYFSSKGHNSIGGFDVFYATLSDEGLWSDVESAGKPVNTERDDMYFITDSYGKKGFYSSDKLEKGNFDIYSVIYP
jgi:hypothetical protein